MTQCHTSPEPQHGFIFLSVVISLLVIAALSLMLSRESGMDINVVASRGQQAQARYISEAGLQHALWQASTSACTGYALPTTGFAGGSYSAVFSPDNGSPITISVNAQTANGSHYAMQRQTSPIYDGLTRLVLQPDAATARDTYLRQGFSAANYGINEHLYVNGNWGDYHRALLYFDLGAIGSGHTVLSAHLLLHSNSSAWSTTTLNIHRLTRNWDEGNVEASWGEASWNQAMTGQNWTTAGGDIDARIYAVSQTPGSDGWVSWDVTALVQQWVSGEQPNFGLLLRATELYKGARFDSSDSGDAEDHPKLVITYGCECGKTCAGAGGGTPLLFVSGGPAALNMATGQWAVVATAQEQLRISKLQSWGYSVTLIADDDTQANFDTALAAHQVVYIPEDADATALDAKLRNAEIGLVNEQVELGYALGISNTTGSLSESQLDITNNSHSITDGMALGNLTITTTAQPLIYNTGGLAHDGLELARVFNRAALFTVNTGGELATAGNYAAGKRVQLPWGAAGFDFNSLNSDGLTLLHRALDWAAMPDSACNADYNASRISSEFSTTGYSQPANRGVTYLPEGRKLGAVNTPPGGAWLMVGDSGLVSMVSMDGTLVDSSFDTGLTMLDGVTWIPPSNATSPGHLALVRNSTLYLSDMSQPAELSFSSFNLTFVTDAGGISYIEGGSFDGMLALADKGNGNIHILLPNFNLHTTLATGGLLSTPEGIAHLKDTDKFLVIDTGTRSALIIDATLNVRHSYDLTPFNLGVPSGAAAAIHPETCQHFFGDHANQRYAYLDKSGAAGHYLDQFTARTCDAAVDYTGSDGSLDWSATTWSENLDGGGSCDGTLSIINDGNNRMSIAGTSPEHFARPVDLGAATTAQLSFDYLQFGPFDNSRYLGIEVSADGGISWSEQGRINYSGDETTYLKWTGDISAHANGNSMIRLLPVNLSATARIYLDNVRIDINSGGSGSGLYYLDTFPDYTCDGADEYHGSQGTLDWSPWAWQEQDDDGRACGAELRVMDDPLIADTSGNRARLQNTNRALQRQADLSGYSGAQLSFSYRRDAMTGGAGITVAVSPDGGTLWSVLGTIPAGNDAAYLSSPVFDLSSYLTADAMIMLMANANFNGTAYIDNVRIAVQGGAGGGGDTPFTCNGSYADDFNTRALDNSTGSIDWSASPWIEINESDGVDSGDTGFFKDVDNYQLRTRDNDGGGEGMERPIDLSGATSASLAYTYRRDALDNLSDYTTVEISTSGADGTWVELSRHAGPADDSAYTTVNLDISSYIGPATRIRFLTSSNMGGNDIVWFENLEIQCAP